MDGTVIPCCGDVTNKLALGNAADGDLEDLWLGKQIFEYRMLHLEGRWRDIEACRKCGLPYI